MGATTHRLWNTQRNHLIIRIVYVFYLQKNGDSPADINCIYNQWIVIGAWHIRQTHHPIQIQSTLTSWQILNTQPPTKKNAAS